MLKVNNKVIKINNKWLNTSSSPQPSLPPYTLRLRFKDDVTPSFSYGTATQVSSSPNIWDYTYVTTNWMGLLSGQYDLLEVIDGNTTGITNMGDLFAYCNALTTVSLFDTSSVTDMSYMFYYCRGLTTVPLFDTSNVTDMNNMFSSCNHLTSIPLFDTSSVTNMDFMFNDCAYVQSGALALYQQASTQTTPPSNHQSTFSNCGANTRTGMAELLQIPSSWGGLDG